MLDLSRPSVAGPSRVNGTIASSTVTDAMVRSSGCGFRTSDADLAGGQLDAADLELVRRRRVAPDQVDDLVAARDHERDRHRKQHDGDERPQAPGDPARGGARLH